MTLLQIMSADAAQVVLRTTEHDQVAEELAKVDVHFEHIDTVASPTGTDSAAILNDYRDLVDKVCRDGGYQLVDVAQLTPDDGDERWSATAEAARQKFLNEHLHKEDEVRFFVDGVGCFYLHCADRVYAVVCGAGDLISVPAGTQHWFDMGQRPDFTAIRFFENEDGWVADFSGDPISSAFPTLDQLLAVHP